MPSPHTKGVIAKILMDCLSQYALENKISSIVVDNCTTNDAMITLLMDKLESRSLVLGGEIFHMRCSAHILNLIVKDGLESIGPAISKVRECVAFWMSTPKRVEKFEEACRLLNVNKPKRMGIDCKTRWNSTYLMLESSLPFKDVFNKLKRLNKRLKFVVPSDDEWTMAALVCRKLEIFYKATKVFSTRNHPTSNVFFRNVCMIRLALRSWMQSGNIEIIITMAKSMVEKFDKYWSHINGILAVAAILDPRNKMECVAHYFTKLYGDVANVELARVRKTLDNLVLEYQNKFNFVNEKSPLSKGIDNECTDDEDDFARSKKQKVGHEPTKGEVDQYLDSGLVPEDNEFNVLNWWKRNRDYPTLKRIAKDILAIPVSSVASESAFSMGGRVVSAHRSRLHSQLVEALMCSQNWMVADVRGNFVQTIYYPFPFLFYFNINLIL